jgi:hypothetical protein
MFLFLAVDLPTFVAKKTPQSVSDAGLALMKSFRVYASRRVSP